MTDSRQAAIEFALKRAALALLSQKIDSHEAVAVVASAMGGITATPRELTVAARQHHRASIVAEIARLAQEGKGTSAAKILASANAADALDPVEVESLANKYRRWDREEKRARARLLCPKSVKG